MEKLKVRCSVCGKSFKTPSAKKTVCPACDADLKRAKHQGAAIPVAAPAVVSSVDVRAALRAAQENQGHFGAYRAPEAPLIEMAPSEPSRAEKPGVRERTAQSVATSGRPARPTARVAPRPHRPAGRPKPRERPVVERTRPFTPSAEQIAAIRERYLSLAQPEFDGIRHRIATDLGIPLRAVKEVVKTVRSETATPSWWDRTGSTLDSDQLAEVRALYVAHLPIPAIGIHKEIGVALKISPNSVYQAIGAIRDELALPRYRPREDGTEESAVVTGVTAQ